MTKQEIDTQLAEAQRKDEERANAARAAGKKVGMPGETLATLITVGGRDLQATLCPVLAMRLRLPEGRDVAELIKGHMQRQRTVVDPSNQTES